MRQRVLVCSGQVPYVDGGSERMLDALVYHLKRLGHQVDTVKIPFTWHSTESVIKSYLAWRLLDLSQVESQDIDTVIALKFPAYVLEHDNKVVWLIQQFRQIYDLFGTPYSPYAPTSPEAMSLRDTIHRIDTRSLSEAQRLMTISKNVSQRLYEHNGVRSQVLYPPPPLDGQFHCEGYGDFIFSLCRLEGIKRVDRLVEAMRYVRTDVTCRIAGGGPERAALEALAHRHGITDRVEFLGRVTDEEAIDLYAQAMAVYYAPYDEDYGLATIEAMKSKKPVLTFDDSGGVLEFVEDGVTGLVTDPDDSRALAQAIDSLYRDQSHTETLGNRGYERVESLNWDHAIHVLLGE